MKKTALLIIIILTLGNVLYGQTSLTIANSTACSGTNVCIPVMTTNMNNIGAISLTIQANNAAAIGSNITVENLHPQLSANGGTTLSTYNSTTNTILFVYFAAGTTGANFGTDVLFNLCFSYLGGSVSFNFIQSPTPCDIADINGNAVLVTYNNGTFNQIAVVDPAGLITGPSTVCQGQANVTYSVASITNATSYVWTVPNGASIISGQGTNSIIVNYNTNAVSGNITVCGHNTCGDGTASSKAITVNPLPGNPGPITGPTSFCQGTQQQFSVGSISYSNKCIWTIPPGASFVGDSTLNTITVSFSNTAQSGAITVKGDNLCGEGVIASSLSVTLKPMPTATVGSDLTIYIGSNTTLSGSATGGVTPYSYSWTPASSLVNPLAQNPTTLPLSANTTFCLVVTGGPGNNCASNQACMTVTITGIPLAMVAINTNDDSICAGSTISLNTTASGGSTGNYTYSWTSNPPGLTSTEQNPSFTLTQTTTFNCTIADGTENVTGQVEVYVWPLPTVTLNNLAEKCINDPAFNLTGGSPAGGVYSGFGIGGGMFDPSVSGSGNFPVTYTYVDSHLCKDTAIKTQVVNPLPIVTLAAFSPICVGSAPIILTGGLPAGGTYDGTGVTNGSFDPGSVTAGTYTITYTYTDGHNCTNSATNTILVNPLPTVTFTGALSDQCVSFTSYNLQGGNPTGGTYSGDGVSGDIFNAFIAGEGPHTITYTYMDGNNCVNSANNTINVLQLPIVTLATFDPVCINTPPFNLTGGLPVNGTYSGNGVTSNQFTPSIAGIGNTIITYAYLDALGCQNSTTGLISVSPLPVVTMSALPDNCLSDAAYPLTGGFPTGGTYSGTGVLNNVFDPAVAGVGTFVITYTYTSTGALPYCTATATTNITVKDLPEVSLSNLGEICINGNTITLTGGLPLGGSYTGTGVSNPVFNPSVAGVGTHQITYTYQNPGTNCINTAINTITVNDTTTPTVPNFGAYCINAGTGQVTLTGASPGGGTYSGNGVSGGIINLQTAGAGTHTITYTYTNNLQCTSSNSNTITIHPLPVVTYTGALEPKCIYEDAYQLTGGLPLYGTYSGTGVTSNNFDPGVAGLGTHQITYKYQNSGTNCINTAINTISVHPAPDVTFNSNLPDQCVSDNSLLLNTGLPPGGTYDGPGISGNNFNASLAGVGTFVITYTYTTTGPLPHCTGSATNTITVHPLTDITFTSALPDMCVNDPPLTLTTGSPANGTYAGDGVSGGIFDPAVAGEGTHTITYSIIDNNSCSNDGTTTITVHPLPNVTFNTALSPQCVSNTNYQLLGGFPANGTYSGPGVSGSIFNASIAGVGTHIITYTFEDGHGCSNYATNTITVYPLPVATGSSQSVSNGWPATLSGSASGGLSPYYPSWTPTALINGSSTIFNPATVNLSATTVFTLYVTDYNGCTSLAAYDTVYVTGGALSVTASATPSSICYGDTTQLTALASGGSQSYTYSWTSVPPGFTSTDDNPLVHPLVTTVYTVSVFDGSNTITDDVTVEVKQLPVVTFNVTTYPCVSATSYTLNQGTPAGGSYNGTSVIGTNFNPSIGQGDYIITYTYTNTITSCVNSDTAKIHVYPLPVVTFPGTLPSPCINDDSTTLSGGLPVNGTYSGTGVTGINFNATTAGTGPHIITYKYMDGNNCVNGAYNTINVDSLPIVSFTIPPNDTKKCIYDVSYTLTGGLPTGGTYSGPGVSAGVFNASASGGLGPKTITYTYLDPITECSSFSNSTITVLPKPVVSWITVLPDQCVSNPPYPLGGATPTGGTYSGPGVSGTYFNPNGLLPGTYVITYTYTNTSNPYCSNSITNTIEVFELPAVNWTNSLPVQCISGTGYALPGGTPPGGIYSGTGVSANIFYPAVAGIGTHTLTYTYNDTHCDSSVTNTITVNNLPNVILGAFSPVCVSVTVYPLTTGLPTGGSYSGTYVSGGIFNPNAAGVGFHTINYSYTDGFGCNKTVSGTIQVKPLPNVQFNTALTNQCVSAPAYILTGGSPAGGSYSGPGVSGNTFVPGVPGVGIYTITYKRVVDGCTDSASQQIEVYALPEVIWSADSLIPQCVSITQYQLSGGIPIGGTYSGTNVTGSIFNPNAYGAGTATIKYEYMDSNNCSNYTTNTLLINPLPVVTWSNSLDQQCINYSGYQLTGGDPPGGTYSGPGVSSSIFNASMVGTTGLKTIIYKYIDPNGCESYATNTIMVNPLPTVQFNQTISNQCISEDSCLLTGGFPTGGTYSGPGVSGNNFNPSSLSPGNYTITYTYKDSNTDCENSATKTVTVVPLPVLTWSNILSPKCVSSTNMPLTGALPLGGSYSGPGVSGMNFNASLAGVGTHLITYTYFDGICTNTITNSIIVNPLPIVTWANALPDRCVDETTFTLSGGTPSGSGYTTVYSGPGVTGTNFNASAAGVDTHLLTYEVTDVNGCKNSAGNSIVVNELPVAGAGTDIGHSVGSYVVLSGTATGGSGNYSYSWTPADSLEPGQSTLQNPQTTGLYTTNTFSLTVTDLTTGCVSVTDNILVYITGIPLSTIATVNHTSICYGDPVTLGSSTEGGNGAYTYSWASNPPGFTSIAASISNVYPLTTTTYYITASDGFVTDTSSIKVNVNQLPNTTFLGTIPPQCIDGNLYTLTQGLPNNPFGIYSGPGISDSLNFDPAIAGIGIHTLTYTYTDLLGCKKSATHSITVKPLPIVSITAPYPDQCYNELTYILSGGTPPGGTYSGNTVNNGIFEPQTAGIGNFIITYEYTDVDGCKNHDEENIEVVFQPKIFGEATYDNVLNTPLDSIRLIRQDMSSVPIDTAVTDASGLYAFKCLQNGIYQIVPSTESEPGGWNATDAYLAAKYYGGTVILSPLRKRASDVNNNGYTNAVDALLIMRRFVGLNSTYPLGDWVFELNNPVTIFNNDITEDVLCLSVGDINGSLTFSKSATITPYDFDGHELVYGVDEDITVPLNANSDITPYALSLVIDLPEENTELVKINTRLKNYEYHVQNNKLRFAWYDTEGTKFAKGEEIISLVFNCPVKIKKSLKVLLSIGTETEFADLNGKRIADAGFNSPEVTIVPLNKENIKEGEAYLETYPNPFRDHTTISFVQGTSSHVKLDINDVYGRTISRVLDSDIEPGQTTVDFDGSMLPPGTYFVRFETSTTKGHSVLTRKLMIIR